jgi:hypothetical protein
MRVNPSNSWPKSWDNNNFIKENPNKSQSLIFYDRMMNFKKNQWKKRKKIESTELTRQTRSLSNWIKITS